METVLYEDDGETLKHQQGQYRWVYAACQRDAERLLITRRTAGQYRPSYTSLKLEIVGLHEEPAEVRVDRQGAPLWFYEDRMLEMPLDDFQRVEVKFKTGTASSSHSERTLPRRP